MSNEEFDNLSEELLWQGSKVAVLRCEHTRRSSQCTALHWAARGLMPLSPFPPYHS